MYQGLRRITPNDRPQLNLVQKDVDDNTRHFAESDKTQIAEFDRKEKLVSYLNEAWDLC